MKIVMICEFFAKGLGFQENALLQEYREMGHDVVVLTSLHDKVFDYYTKNQ